MRILIDECLPKKLTQDFPGHEVQTVPRAGWGGISNGKLLKLISQSKAFDVFVTMDKNMEYQQRVKDLPFAVVVLRAKSNTLEDTHPIMPDVLRALTSFQPGHVYYFSKAD
ncbi:MAG TPA: DUF5615 family PIN-like protein [Verrucomicrobiae bacterium]|jgi:predicted nuclease of predicted toxin-antitoxin system|nr:DUF5615 family PIN-like protein [Verrucomicrobiae bacterium]